MLLMFTTVLRTNRQLSQYLDEFVVRSEIAQNSRRQNLQLLFLLFLMRKNHATSRRKILPNPGTPSPFQQQHA